MKWLDSVKSLFGGGDFKVAPNVFIGKNSGNLHQGNENSAITEEAFKKALEEALSKILISQDKILNTKQDYGKIEKSAKQGNTQAQLDIGLFYYNVEEGKQDYIKAKTYWEKAAKKGLAEAQNNLGVLYYEGRGIPKNYTHAYIWLSLANANGHENAKKNLDAVSKKMSHEEIEKAQQKTTEIVEKTPKLIKSQRRKS